MIYFGLFCSGSYCLSSQLDALKSWMLRQSGKKLSMEQHDPSPGVPIGEDDDAGRENSRHHHEDVNNADSKNVGEENDDQSLDCGYTWIPRTTAQRQNHGDNSSAPKTNSMQNSESFFEFESLWIIFTIIERHCVAVVVFLFNCSPFFSFFSSSFCPIFYWWYGII